MKIICSKEEFASMLFICHGNASSGDGCENCALIRACCACKRESPTNDINPIVDVCKVEEEEEEIEY